MKDVPSGPRSRRRDLSKDEETIVLMLQVARDAGRRVVAAEHETTRAKDVYAQRCLDLHESGMSLAQITIGLGISRAEVLRLIDRARELEQDDH